MLGVAELLLASQQYFFWLAPRLIIYTEPAFTSDLTIILSSRTDRWDLSIITAALSIAAGIMLYRARSSRLCQAAMLILALWGALCTLEFRRRPDAGVGSMYLPVKDWHMSPFLQGVLLDWTFIPALVLGPLILLVAMSGFFLIPPPDSKETTKCRSCKYDLTGNLSGVCPECGKAISEDQKSQLVIAPSADGHATAVPRDEREYAETPPRSDSRQLSQPSRLRKRISSHKGLLAGLMGMLSLMMILLAHGLFSARDLPAASDSEAHAEAYYTRHRQHPARDLMSKSDPTSPYFITRDWYNYSHSWPGTTYSPEMLQGGIDLGPLDPETPRRWDGNSNYHDYALENKLGAEAVRYLWYTTYRFNGSRVAEVDFGLQASTSAGGWRGSLDIDIVTLPDNAPSDLASRDNEDIEWPRLFVVAHYRFKSLLNSYYDQEVYEIKPNGDFIQLESLPSMEQSTEPQTQQDLNKE
jgi:hypothetical protein